MAWCGISRTILTVQPNMSRNFIERLNRSPASLALTATLLLNGCATPAGFKAVFNGRDFTGRAGPVENYEVKDGAIVCKPGKGGTIFTKEEYSDFVVRFEFKLPPGGNNGLAIRYPGHGDTAYDGMCECQVLDDNYEKVTGQAIDPRQAHGSAYGMVAAARGYQRPIGEWNLTVVGSTIKVVLNGTMILDAGLSQVTEFMDGKSHPGKDRTTGHFGFAGHNDPVMFRHISIQPLKQSPSRGGVSYSRPILMSELTSPIASSDMLVVPGKADESIFVSDAMDASFSYVNYSSHL
jgi:Domain of Unknown Function (DUF1080)